MSTQLVLGNANFVPSNVNVFNGEYVWDAGTIALIVPAFSISTGSTYTPIIENMKLNDVDVITGDMTITLERYDFGVSSYDVIGGAITVSETDQLIRYKVYISIKNVYDKEYDTDYKISFDISNNIIDSSPLSITVNHFRLPLIAQITRPNTNNISDRSQEELSILHWKAIH